MTRRRVPKLDIRKRWARRRSRTEAPNTENQLYRHGDPPDVLDPRAKSSRHGKVTADHWNR
jgi:hypothetical protein